MNPAIRATCLTAPAVGGIAVVQVVGRGAADLVGRHFRRKTVSAANLAELAATRVVLGCLMEGEEVLDDALVSVRRNDRGEEIVDLCLHGGPRIVQRVLLMLEGVGVAMVEPRDLLAESWSARSAIEAEAYKLLLEAKTRRVACWLAGLAERLTAELQSILRNIEQGHAADAAVTLQRLTAGYGQTQRLIRGVRVVLTGQPNTGKSTLANALAGCEGAIVSEHPGTTRDWTEHAAAIDGIPFTLVDTAGIRDTDDPIEAEAIRRTAAQLWAADVILEVEDRSRPWAAGCIPGMVSVLGMHPEALESHRRDAGATRVSGYTMSGRGDQGHVPCCLCVWNKSDLPAHPSRQEALAAHRRQVIDVSARTGEGLDTLRAALVKAAGLVGGGWPVAAFTGPQYEACRCALAAVALSPSDPGAATAAVETVLARPIAAERHFARSLP